MEMNNDKVLTIAIPTYNRISKLKRTLERLVPQLNELCYLLILDNHSDVLVEDEVKGILSELDSNQYHIYRNRVNIGGDPNIHKCFEYCTTKWLWTLSDDDLIETDAVKTIFDTIKEYPDAMNVNFYSPHPLHPVRHSSDLFYGKEGLINSIDVLGAAIFISSNIYNMSQIRNYHESCRQTYSCASQWLIILFNISDEYFVVRSNKIIVINDYCSDKYTSVNLTIINGFMSILDISLSKKIRRKLIEKLLTVDDGWIKFPHIIKLILIENKRNGIIGMDPLFLFRNYYNRFYKYGRFRNKLMYCFFFPLIKFSPNIAFEVIRFIIKLKPGHKDINLYI